MGIKDARRLLEAQILPAADLINASALATLAQQAVQIVVGTLRETTLGAPAATVAAEQLLKAANLVAARDLMLAGTMIARVALNGPPWAVAALLPVYEALEPTSAPLAGAFVCVLKQVERAKRRAPGGSAPG